MSRKRKHNTLDGILSSVTKLHSSLASSSTVSRREAYCEEVASQYLLAAPPPMPMGAPPPLGAKEICKNPQCGRSIFETDMRRGDRICSHCGIVQNARSMESQEEEHRTFADDDKSEGRKRAEVTGSGPMGTRVAETKYQRAQQIIASAGDGDDKFSDSDRKRLDGYQEKTRQLAQRMYDLPRAALDDALSLCEQLVCQEVEHEKQCTVGETCRLRKKAKGQAITSAAVLSHALKKNRIIRQWEEYVGYLEELDVKVAAGVVQRRADVIKHLLDHTKFGCGVEGEAVLRQGEDGDEEGEAEGAIVNERSALLPRVRGALRLPYVVESKARDIIRMWTLEGIKAITNQSVNACAIVRAYEQVVANANGLGGAIAAQLPPLDMDKLAEVVQLNRSTIERNLRDLPAPDLNRTPTLQEPTADS